MTKPKLDCCEQRWVSKLACYNFDIKYVPGTRNVVADALSRVPFCKSIGYRLVHEPFSKLIREATAVSDTDVHQAFKASANQSMVREKDTTTMVSHAQSLCISPQSLSTQEVSAVFQSHTEWATGARTRAAALVSQLPQLVPEGLPSLPAHSVGDLRDAQLQDPTLSRIHFYMERSRRPSRRERAQESRQVLRLLKHWEKFILSDDILYRVSRDQISKTRRHQYVVPDRLKAEVLKGVHDSADHQGQSRTLSIARQRFFWLHMDRDVREYVRHCQRCIVSKVLEPDGRAPLESIVTTRPLELVCIDFWSAEDSHNKSVDVLVITDHFTRLAQAFACRDQSAKQVAKVLWEKYFCIYGFPERVHSDQGPSFESELIAELLKLSGVRKSHTTPYHPMGNGSVERFNRTLGNMIRALPPEAKQDWPRRLQTLTFMYNCTSHETTGYAPFYLMFGRVPRLPVDVLFRNVLTDPDVTDFDRYVTKLSDDLKEAMLIAQEHATKEQGRQTRLYNRRIKGVAIEIGDRVLVANKKERGKRKIADRWESTVYTVIDKNAKTHTYKIQDTVTGRERVVHRNLLMLVNFLPVRDMPQSLQSSPLMSSVPSSVSDVNSRASGQAASGHMDDQLFAQPDESQQVVEDVVHSPYHVNDECLSNPISVCLRSSPDAMAHVAADRTRDWVNNTETPSQQLVPLASGPHTDLTDDESTENVSHLSSDSHTVHTDDTVDKDDALTITGSHTAHTDKTVHKDDALTISQHDGPDSSSDCLGDTAHTDVHTDHSETAPHRTTRLGRIIRPVNRLLYTISRQDITKRLQQNVQAVCNSVQALQI